MASGGSRVRAPELRGRGWLNTGGAAYAIADLRGRFVLLDFWTFCCVNCLHVLDELRVVEQKYAEQLVVVGVHSPKFAHESDPQALAAALERHAVRHPVLDDAELVTWSAYTARAWPTLVLIDPEGYVVAQYAGEGHAHAIDRLLADLVEVHRDKGTLRPAGSPYVAPPVESTTLRFPADALPLADSHVLVADAGHDRVVELDANGAEVRGWTGVREPNGLCRLPGPVAERVGYDVVVAATGSHRLHGLSLVTGELRALVGDGRGWMPGDGVERLSSPWGLAWHGRGERGRVWVAMAGIHQLWTFDPLTGSLEVAGGTTNEGLVDGALTQAWFAQTSGLAAHGNELWLVDAETSSLRVADLVHHTVETRVGQGLFDFGLRDGPAAQALLQHPLGVTVLPDGSIAVCDTYNGAIRRYDGRAGEVTTLATGLAEPSSAYVDGVDLVVVESAAHQLTRVPLGGAATRMEGFVTTTTRPVTDVAAELELEVLFSPPPGQDVDDRDGPGAQLVVAATPPMLLRHGAGRASGLRRRLHLDLSVGGGVLHIAARAASCDIEVDGAPAPGAACHVHQQDWGIPVRVTAAGAHVLELPLGVQSI